MSATGNSRALTEKEIKKIVAQDKAKKQSEVAKKISDWPGDDNLELLAEAVKHRRQLVMFDTREFTIRYDDQNKVVFIRPVNENQFAPCGYFEYDRLRAVIA